MCSNIMIIPVSISKVLLMEKISKVFEAGLSVNMAYTVQDVF